MHNTLDIPGLNQTFFSIIILCWNSNQFIKKCLQSLNEQTYNNFEIILIDNGSPDPVPEWILDEFLSLDISFFKLNENLGFAEGNNFGAKEAKGKYLALLNADAFPTPTWLEKVKNAIDIYPNLFFASLLINANDPDLIDGAGDVYHVSGQVWRKYYNYKISEVSIEEKEVFSACGAAAIYPIDIFREVNGFDSDFFSYVEDIDLGFRLRLRGYKCILLPDAIVHHVGSGSTKKNSDFSVYYGQRNLEWAFIKNMPTYLFWVTFPLHLLTNLLSIIVSIFRKQLKITLRAKIDALEKVPLFLQKRKQIQSLKKTSPITLVAAIDWNPFSLIFKLRK